MEGGIPPSLYQTLYKYVGRYSTYTYHLVHLHGDLHFVVTVLHCLLEHLLHLCELGHFVVFIHPGHITAVVLGCPVNVCLQICHSDNVMIHLMEFRIGLYVLHKLVHSKYISLNCFVTVLLSLIVGTYSIL